jgi:hypothetical protein
MVQIIWEFQNDAYSLYYTFKGTPNRGVNFPSTPINWISNNGRNNTNVSLPKIG